MGAKPFLLQLSHPLSTPHTRKMSQMTQQTPDVAVPTNNLRQPSL